MILQLHDCEPVLYYSFKDFHPVGNLFFFPQATIDFPEVFLELLRCLADDLYESHVYPEGEIVCFKFFSLAFQLQELYAKIGDKLYE